MKNLIWSLITSLILFELFPLRIMADSDQYPAQTHLFLGWGIIDACQRYELDAGPHSNLSADVCKHNKNFDRTAQWVIDNLFTRVRIVTDYSASKPVAGLWLHSTDGPTIDSKGVNNVLIAIPLNELTLGKDYQKRVAELHDIMTSPDI